MIIYVFLITTGQGSPITNLFKMTYEGYIIQTELKIHHK